VAQFQFRKNTLKLCHINTISVHEKYTKIVPHQHDFN